MAQIQGSGGEATGPSSGPASRPERPFGRRRWYSKALVLLLVGGSIAVDSVGQSRLRGVVREAERAGITTGVAVFDGSGRRVYGHREAESFIPASNQKLLTAIAFLATLGPDASFETGFEVMDGELVVTAGADPNWRTGSAYDPDTLFSQVATRIREARPSIRSVRLDPGSYTGRSRGTSWPEGQLDRSYCAPSGAVSLDGSRYAVRVSRGGGQYDATVTVEQPSSGAPLLGSVDLGSGKPSVRLESGQFRLDGALGSNGRAVVVRGNVEEPEALFLESLRTVLGRHGVRIDRRAPAVDIDLPSIRTPAREALERMLRESNNFDAEQCFRRVGAEHGDGSYEGSSRAVREALARIGVDLPVSVVVADGSGLSRDNRISPQILGRVLVAASEASFADALRDLLPYPGLDPSTLKRRFGGRVDRSLRAKTGTIRGVSSLSGYLDTRAGTYSFSILMAGSGSSTMRRFQERVVQAIREEAP